jgi:uncharacterized membrane protein YcaP (DUF421 family)
MDKSFHVFDLHRMFVGDAPLTYLLEIVFRTIIMYGYTIFLLRVLGKRGMGQLSTLELAIIISFGSAVGDPMVAADMPILHGITAITVITFLQIRLERFVNRYKKVEAVMEGTANMVVEDGVIKWECMKQDNISREDLFRSLRQNEVDHLGQVRKAYFETNGQISVLFQPPKKVKAGLNVIPEIEVKEEEIFTPQRPFPKSGSYACLNCGYTKQVAGGTSPASCEKCEQDKWVKAEQTEK